MFRDRLDAGAVLAEMLGGYGGSGAIVLAVPAGGVAVAAVVAGRLGLGLDVAVVSKITPPWNAEVGYGAVAFDGSVVLNEALLRSLGLSRQQVRAGIEGTKEKVGAGSGCCAAASPCPTLPAGR